MAQIKNMLFNADYVTFGLDADDESYDEGRTALEPDITHELAKFAPKDQSQTAATQRGETFWVAKVNDQVVGCIASNLTNHIREGRDHEPYWLSLISCFEIDEEYRKSGLRMVLLDQVLSDTDTPDGKKLHGHSVEMLASAMGPTWKSELLRQSGFVDMGTEETQLYGKDVYTSTWFLFNGGQTASVSV